MGAISLRSGAAAPFINAPLVIAKLFFLKKKPSGLFDF
jgi:hypothetical protein